MWDGQEEMSRTNPRFLAGTTKCMLGLSTDMEHWNRKKFRRKLQVQVPLKVSLRHPGDYLIDVYI